MKLNDYSPIWWKKKSISNEIIFNKIKILLLAFDEGCEIEREGHKNLLAIDEQSNIIWIAQLPTEVYDGYYTLELKHNILFAHSSNSYISEIDPNTGEILKKYMIK